MTEPLDEQSIVHCGHSDRVFAPGQQVLDRARGSPGNPDNDPVVGHKLDALKDEWNAIMPRLAATIPTTLLGAKAVARVARVSVAERKIDWKTEIDNPGEQLLYNAINWLAEY